MKAVEYFNKLNTYLPEIAINIIEELAQIGQKAASTSTLFKEHSESGLKHNIKIIKSGKFVREVLADKWYAYFVEYGNNQKGQFIRPVRAKALRFISNGQLIFSKKVKAHGPIPFMHNAKDIVEKMIVSVGEKHINEWISKNGH